MKKILYLLLALFALNGRLLATHNIAGEITYTCTGLNTFDIFVTTYTNSLSPADRCELTVYFGDGDFAIAPRVNGPNTGICPNATDGETLLNYTNTKKNIYKVTHTYPGPGTYTIHITDPNRIAGIDNIPNSVNVPFYLQSILTVSPFIGCNSSPSLTNLPLDKACVNHCFYHNPGAVDPDGDSLSYALGPCLADSTGNIIAGYTIIPATINAVTGDLSWCSPTTQGKFNVCIYIYQWHKLPSGGSVNIGYVLRDMQIDVGTCTNENPEITDLHDTCIIAGTTLNFNVTATDPDSVNNIELTAYGGPFLASPAATFTAPSGFAPQPVVGVFNWNTSCDNVRLQPYIATFKARDNDIPIQLTDIESMQITVISPGPQAVSATPQATSMLVNWTLNPCNPTGNPCIGYRIYRHTGATSWTPGPCETGVPAYTGYVYVGTVTGYSNTSFLDNNNGSGLIPGVTYCYRVHADFIDGSMSISSPEACNELKHDIPVITHADAETPGTLTDVHVRWINAIAADLDTVQHPGPYVLRIYRSPGLNYTAPALIASYTNNFLYQLPTHHLDTGLPLATQPFSYRISFFAANGTDSIGITQSASTVFLTATPSDNAVTLGWQHNVPWTNFRYAVFRKNNTTLLWDSIATVSNPLLTYKDSNLVNGTEQCYFVRAVGSYSNPLYPDSLLNRSQFVCATPQDMTAPCSPVLGVNSDCYNFVNQLIWTNPISMGCADDVVGYHVYYSPTDSGQLTLLYTYNSPTDTNHTYDQLPSVAGCYAVTAFDTLGNESPFSNVICIDNCPFYELPNVFSPDGDGTNDEYIAFPWRSVRDVDFKMYDRWGVLVYETTDPNIHWNGRMTGTNKLCTDGVYYYVCTVNEIHLQGVIPRQLKGFVHLFGNPSKHE